MGPKSSIPLVSGTRSSNMAVFSASQLQWRRFHVASSFSCPSNASSPRLQLVILRVCYSEGSIGQK